jgi:hypothetical protein
MTTLTHLFARIGEKDIMANLKPAPQANHGQRRLLPHQIPTTGEIQWE